MVTLENEFSSLACLFFLTDRSTVSSCCWPKRTAGSQTCSRRMFTIVHTPYGFHAYLWHTMKSPKKSNWVLRPHCRHRIETKWSVHNVVCFYRTNCSSTYFLLSIILSQTRSTKQTKEHPQLPLQMKFRMSQRSEQHLKEMSYRFNWMSIKGHCCISTNSAFRSRLKRLC